MSESPTLRSPAPDHLPTRRMVFDRLPSRSDPRWPVAGILLCYVVLGITLLGFNRSPAQVLLVVAGVCALDMSLHAALRRREVLFPLSAAISGLSLVILLNFAHSLWLPLLPVVLTVASKYLITHDGRHVFNPSLFGVAVSLFIGGDMISAAPAYQWGGSLAMTAFVVTAALMLFVGKIRRTWLILSFLGFYALSLAVRAWLVRHHLPPETLFLGALSSPPFYLFTFFMITDPATSPASRRGQIVMALSIVIIDFILNLSQSYYTLFYAGFIYFTGRWIFLHFSDIAGGKKLAAYPWRATAIRWVALGGFCLGTFFVGRSALTLNVDVDPNFYLVEIAAEEAGIRARPGDLLERVDPRLAHVGKWLLSIGDAVAVADADNDGLQDVFLTLPLKDASDRAALYRNLGGFRFQRVPLPALSDLVENPERLGLPSGALWLDYDNDGDSDLLVLVAFGEPILLHNQLVETGKLDFVDRTRTAGLAQYMVSVTANALDIDRDGCLDLIIGNAISPWLDGYETPTPFNIFRLPAAAYPGDRRMFNVMHRTWHDADNGGANAVYFGNCGGFRAADGAALGLGGRRWTLDIGTGDLNGDGWTDLYMANDFGPDRLYLNRAGQRFERVGGSFVGEIGRDTYKGMNSTIADFDNNGFPDIYVSNVHHPLQAEGSLLWMNSGEVDRRGHRAFRDQAAGRAALNERRFGWGAAAGDLDRDGRLDLAQANGMVDDSYDTLYEGCPDYWYWNGKIAMSSPDIHGYADRWADLRGRCIFPSEYSRIYLNQGRFFVDVGKRVGWNQPGNARGVALVDLDNDGDLDILVTHQFAPPSLYRNDIAANHWVGFDLRGNGRECNRDALGTKIRLRYTTENQVVTQYREVQASNGFSSQGDRRIFVGLGSYQGLVEAEVNWCGKRTADTYRFEPDRYHRVEQE